MRWLAAILGMIAIGIGTYSAYRTYESDRRASHIFSEQQDLQKRIDALKSEMQVETRDPAEIKLRQDRLNALQTELNALKKEGGDVPPK